MLESTRFELGQLQYRSFVRTAFSMVESKAVPFHTYSVMYNSNSGYILKLALFVVIYVSFAFGINYY